MPRSRTEPSWDQKIFALKAEEPDLSASAIYLRFSEQWESGTGPDDFPSERTIRRRLKDWHSLTEPEQRQYDMARWPDAMGLGLLPWEASETLIVLLKDCADRGAPRPTVRFAKWFHRAHSIAKDAPMRTLRDIAGQLSAWEITGSKPGSQEAVEWFLAYAPWRGDDEEAAYRRAIEAHLIPAWIGPSIDTEGLDDERLRKAIETVGCGDFTEEDVDWYFEASKRLDKTRDRMLRTPQQEGDDDEQAS